MCEISNSQTPGARDGDQTLQAWSASAQRSETQAKACVWGSTEGKCSEATEIRAVKDP